MDIEKFRTALLSRFTQLQQVLATPQGDWTVKGFVDVYRNVYTISVDTKVVSKIIELMLLPVISQFAADDGYNLILCEYQNHYPDITLIASDGTKIALDLKSTYRTGDETVNGFTLGAFTGYFRQRHITKNIVFPYQDYAAHFILGVIYSRSAELGDERQIYSLDELADIVSVARHFTFLLQEKWRIAADRPGSGNTKNIGSVIHIPDLVSGNGPFAPYGLEVFDDYWMNYLTADMARAIDSEIPYRSLAEYWAWRERAPRREG